MLSNILQYLDIYVMAPTGKIGDAEYVFRLFFHTGPITLGIGDVAKQLGVQPSSIRSKLRTIQKRNPGFQLGAVTKGRGLVFKEELSDVKTPASKATLTPASRKKAAEATNQAHDAAPDTDTRRRTRSASRADRVVSESEDDEVQQKVSKTKSRAPKSITVSKTKDASATSGYETKSKTDSTATNEEAHDDESNKENKDHDHDFKPTPRIRGGRKSVGRELEETPLLDLPKPAPRGRNTSKARNLVAKEKEPVEEESSTTKSIEEAEIIENVEESNEAFPTNGETTNCVKELLVQTAGDIVVGTKRKRTPSVTSVSPSGSIRVRTGEGPDEENLEDIPRINIIKNARAAPILTPPESPSKRPQVKKQKVGSGLVDEQSQDVTNAKIALPDSAVAGSEVSAIGDISNPATAPQILLEHPSKNSLEQVIEIRPPASPEADVLNLFNNELVSTSGDDQRNDDLDSAQDTVAMKAAIPGRFPWMSWDPEAVPDSPSSEGLGRVVSNEYAREWQERNERDAVAKAESATAVSDC